MHNIVNSILVLYINHRFTNCVIPPYIDWVQGDKKSGTDRWFPTIKRSVYRPNMREYVKVNLKFSRKRVIMDTVKYHLNKRILYKNPQYNIR